MADNRDLASLTGNVATDERTIGGSTVHVQRVNDTGGTSIASGQASVGTSATSIAAARDTRKSIVVTNFGTADIYVGPSGVSTSSGHKVEVGGSISLATTAQVFGVSASAGQSVHYVEIYD